MASTTRDIDGLPARWLRACFLGWLLGLVGVMALALLADLVSLGNAQLIVGVGVGAGVGHMQGRALSAWLARPASWMAASTIGMGTLFALHDLAAITGVELPYSLPLYVIMGGLVTGLWQRFLLRPFSLRANWWIPTSLVAWTLPAAALALGDWESAGLVGAVSGPVAIVLGGVLVGAASGAPLAWLLRHPAV